MLSNNEYEVTIQSNTVTTHIVTFSDEVHKNRCGQCCIANCIPK